MTDWAYTLSDGTTGTVTADDLNAAGIAALAKATNGRTVTLVQRVEPADTASQAAVARLMGLGFTEVEARAAIRYTGALADPIMPPAPAEILLESPNGQEWKLGVDDTGLTSSEPT